jgi:hypothetical protein
MWIQYIKEIANDTANRNIILKEKTTTIQIRSVFTRINRPSNWNSRRTTKYIISQKFKLHLLLQDFKAPPYGIKYLLCLILNWM